MPWPFSPIIVDVSLPQGLGPEAAMQLLETALTEEGISAYREPDGDCGTVLRVYRRYCPSRDDLSRMLEPPQQAWAISETVWEDVGRLWVRVSHPLAERIWGYVLIAMLGAALFCLSRPAYLVFVFGLGCGVVAIAYLSFRVLALARIDELASLLKRLNKQETQD